MKQRKAGAKSAPGFSSETVEELEVGEDEILLSRCYVIQEIELRVGTSDLSGAALEAAGSPGRSFDTADDGTVIRDRVEFMGSRAALDAHEREKNRLEALVESVFQPCSDMIFDDGFEVAGVSHYERLNS